MGPLEGVRVLDFTIFQQGPQASVMFADMGADVVKVEPPKFGDLGRLLGPVGEDRFSPYFYAHNRGKRSITLNLKNAEATKICLQLAERSDTLLHNFRPGVMERLGLGYDDVRRVNPRIIYGHASGWGTKGRRAGHPAFDLAAQAQGGMVSVTGEPGGFPLPAGAAIADHVGAMQLALGIMTALYNRERTGVGQKVETSLLGSALSMQAWEIQFYVTHGKLGRAGRGHAYLPTIWRVFQTTDSYVVVGGMPPNRWPAFCKAVGKPDLKLDMEKIDEIYAVLDEVFPTKSTEEWMKLLEDADCICAPVATYEDLLHDEQARANEYVIDIEHPTQGLIPTVGPPWAFSETPAEAASAAPELGQQTEDILQELAYSWEEITALRERGALG